MRNRHCVRGCDVVWFGMFGTSSVGPKSSCPQATEVLVIHNRKNCRLSGAQRNYWGKFLLLKEYCDLYRL